MKPLIGVNVDIKPGTAEKPPECSLQAPYIEAIQKSGGIPVLIPPMSDSDLALIVERLSGVVFVGGPDYHPAHYGEEIEEHTKMVDMLRDEFDFRFFNQVLEHTNIPTLGICLGSQLFNVALGGSLIQHIPHQFPESKVEHSTEDGWKNGFNKHLVILEEGSKLFDIYKKNELNVTTSHHQAVKDVGNKLKVVARAQDGVVEAVELDDSRFLIGVQWHPEREYEQSKCLFDEFVRACASHSA